MTRFATVAVIFLSLFFRHVYGADREIVPLEESSETTGRKVFNSVYALAKKECKEFVKDDCCHWDTYDPKVLTYERLTKLLQYYLEHKRFITLRNNQSEQERTCSSSDTPLFVAGGLGGAGGAASCCYLVQSTHVTDYIIDHFCRYICCVMCCGNSSCAQGCIIPLVLGMPLGGAVLSGALGAGTVYLCHHCKEKAKKEAREKSEEHIINLGIEAGAFYYTFIKDADEKHLKQDYEFLEKDQVMNNVLEYFKPKINNIDDCSDSSSAESD